MGKDSEVLYIDHIANMKIKTKFLLLSNLQPTILSVLYLREK